MRLAPALHLKMSKTKDMRAVSEKIPNLPPEHTKGKYCHDGAAERYESEWKQHAQKTR